MARRYNGERQPGALVGIRPRETNINRRLDCIVDFLNNAQIVSPEQLAEYNGVETITLDYILRQTNIDHIDFLKLDVEGMESQIVTSPGFAQISPKINTIVGEYHDWGFASKDFFRGTLQSLGFHFSWIPNMEADMFTCVK